jgi:CRP-like cAMP-binding protein
MRAGTREQELVQVPLFRGCKPEQLRWIAKHGDVIELPRGSVLCTEGTTARQFIVVLSGVAYPQDDGAGLVYGPGSHFGELGLLGSGTNPHTVAAISPVRLLVLDARSFSGLLARMPTIGVKLLRNLASQVRATKASPRRSRFTPAAAS